MALLSATAVQKGGVDLYSVETQVLPHRVGLTQSLPVGAPGEVLPDPQASKPAQMLRSSLAARAFRLSVF